MNLEAMLHHLSIKVGREEEWETVAFVEEARKPTAGRLSFKGQCCSPYPTPPWLNLLSSPEAILNKAPEAKRKVKS